MADQPSSTKKSKKKGGEMVKRVRDLFKRTKSINDLASQSNLTRVSVASALGDHDPVPGNEAGSTEPTVSGKYINSILVLSTTTSPLQMTEIF